jgi:hypothetical protein
MCVVVDDGRVAGFALSFLTISFFIYPGIEHSILYQDEIGDGKFIRDYGRSFSDDPSHTIKKWNGNQTGAGTIPLPYAAQSNLIVSNQTFLPFWEMSPFLSYDQVNIDILQDDRGRDAMKCIEEGAIVVGDMLYAPPGGRNHPHRDTSTYAQLLSMSDAIEKKYQGDAMSYIYLPIFDSFEEDRVGKAVLVGLINWGKLFRDVLPREFTGIDLVLHNDCSESYTYRLESGGEVTPVGFGVSYYVHHASSCCTM